MLATISRLKIEYIPKSTVRYAFVIMMTVDNITNVQLQPEESTALGYVLSPGIIGHLSVMRLKLLFVCLLNDIKHNDVLSQSLIVCIVDKQNNECN